MWGRVRLSTAGNSNLELLEGLLVARRLVHLQRVELDRLGEGAALAHGHHVPDLQSQISID